MLPGQSRDTFPRPWGSPHSGFGHYRLVFVYSPTLCIWEVGSFKVCLLLLHIITESITFYHVMTHKIRHLFSWWGHSNIPTFKLLPVRFYRHFCLHLLVGAHTHLAHKFGSLDLRVDTDLVQEDTRNGFPEQM